MRMDSISVNNYNRPSFGIKRANTTEYKRVMKTLATLNPEAKREFDLGLDKFCIITQRNGIKGTFTPTKINCNNGYTTLEYRIDGLHANGYINPYKMSKLKIGQIYADNYPEQKSHRKQKGKKYTTIIDNVPLEYKHAGNVNSDSVYLSLLSSVMDKYNISIAHRVGVTKNAKVSTKGQRYLNNKENI